MGRVVPFKKPRSKRRKSWGFPTPRLPSSWGSIALALLAVAIYFLWPEPDPTAVEGAHFAMCTSPPHYNCVIDGDTFYYQDQSIRIADINAPETGGAQCAYEANLGERATYRLQALLNEGPFMLAPMGRDTDKYGRKLRIVERDGQSLGDKLVDEGLAREWVGHRRSWCN